VLTACLDRAARFFGGKAGAAVDSRPSDSVAIDFAAVVVVRGDFAFARLEAAGTEELDGTGGWADGGSRVCGTDASNTAEEFPTPVLSAGTDAAGD
jgi:hypothetical protein